MKRHWSYLKYVLRHKWFVWQASRKIGAEAWLAVIHDASKFRPSEWTPYACTFYKPDGSKQYDETPAFNLAWLLHQHRNPHHWQHWLLRMDRGDVLAIEMPRRYVLEMVADWMGAGRAITGRWECAEWYAKNREKIVLHENTRRLVDGILCTANAGVTGAAEPRTVGAVLGVRPISPQDVIREADTNYDLGRKHGRDEKADLLDWAETLLCNAVPMAHCTQADWDDKVRRWRDEKHGVSTPNARLDRQEEAKHDA